MLDAWGHRVPMLKFGPFRELKDRRGFGKGSIANGSYSSAYLFKNENTSN